MKILLLMMIYRVLSKFKDYNDLKNKIVYYLVMRKNEMKCANGYKLVMDKYTTIQSVARILKEIYLFKYILTSFIKTISQISSSDRVLSIIKGRRRKISECRFQKHYK